MVIVLKLSEGKPNNYSKFARLDPVCSHARKDHSIPLVWVKALSNDFRTELT